jgi:hypothetical protein
LTARWARIVSSKDYVDINPFEKNSQDHRCGLNTRDGHTGTDFALIDFASVEQGVDVLAAAPGHVFRLRHRTQPSPTLWLNPPEYHATILRFAGFSNAVPKFEDTVSGAARLTNSKPNQPLVVYVEAGFSQHGDILDISATGPLGEAFRHSILLKQPKKSTRRAFGKRAPQEGWSLGEYTGQIILTRKGQIIANRFAHVTVAH